MDTVPGDDTKESDREQSPISRVRACVLEVTFWMVVEVRVKEMLTEHQLLMCCRAGGNILADLRK